MFFNKKIKLNKCSAESKDIDKEKNPFGDKGYTMKDSYNAEDLFIANLTRVSSRYTDSGPIQEVTEQKYLFEILTDGVKVKYREIFTGFIAETESDFLDLPYVYEVVPYLEAFPDMEGMAIPKLALLWELNLVNDFEKKKKKEKEKIYTK